MKEKLWKKVGRAIHAYHLLENNDRVLAGISGGTDSLVMLEVLASRMKYIPLRYQLEAIHVQMEDMPGRADQDYLKRFCDKLGIKLHLIAATTKGSGNKKKSLCFTCSWNRRKTVFQKASEGGFNKIAFAHHMDDVLETLFMNMTFHGEFSSIPPKMPMFEGRFELIRPMILTGNEEIDHYAETMDIQPVQAECPYEENNKRELFRDMVKQISSIHPLAKINLYNSMGNIFPDYLPSRPSEG